MLGKVSPEPHPPCVRLDVSQTWVCIKNLIFWQAIYHSAQAVAESSNLEEIIQGGAPQAEGFRARIAADVMEKHHIHTTFLRWSMILKNHNWWEQPVYNPYVASETKHNFSHATRVLLYYVVCLA